MGEKGSLLTSAWSKSHICNQMAILGAFNIAWSRKMILYCVLCWLYIMHRVLSLIYLWILANYGEPKNQNSKFGRIIKTMHTGVWCLVALKACLLNGWIKGRKDKWSRKEQGTVETEIGILEEGNYQGQEVAVLLCLHETWQAYYSRKENWG